MAEIQKSLHDVIIKPVVSEKSYANSDRGQYTFVVAKPILVLSLVLSISF